MKCAYDDIATNSSSIQVQEHCNVTEAQTTEEGMPKNMRRTDLGENINLPNLNFFMNSQTNRKNSSAKKGGKCQILTAAIIKRL